MLNQDKMPGAGSVADTIDFMKQIWSSMGAPSMATPSLSVEDINKKISDLKTVASWLELNLNMLKATIQTLEVQSATLSTLQAMSAIMASRGETADAPEQEASAAMPSFPFGFPMWPGTQAAAGGASSDETPDENDVEERAEAADVDHAADVPQEPVADATPAGDATSAPSADFQSAIANPNAWWNVLQEQFKHAVGNAMAGAGAGAVEEPLLKPVKPSKTVAKPAKRSKNKTVKPATAKTRTTVLKTPKAKPAPPSRAVKGVKAAVRPAAAKPQAGKAPKTAANTSASARAAVVQSRQNKKPASRKPTSP